MLERPVSLIKTIAIFLGYFMKSWRRFCVDVSPTLHWVSSGIFSLYSTTVYNIDTVRMHEDTVRNTGGTSTQFSTRSIAEEVTHDIVNSAVKLTINNNNNNTNLEHFYKTEVQTQGRIIQLKSDTATNIR